MVREQHRLGVLQVGIARQHGIHLTLRQFDQGMLERNQLRIQRIALSTQPEPHVGRHLVVTASRGVQFARYRAEPIAQQRFDRRMYVLGVRRKLKCAALQLRNECLEALDELCGLVGREDRGGAQHARVGDAAQNIVSPEPLIERQRVVKPLDQLVRLPIKPSTPEFTHQLVPSV